MRRREKAIDSVPSICVLCLHEICQLMLSVGTGLPPLSIFNTMTRRKETFVPLHPPIVTLYVCGVTVYDFSHLGLASSQLPVSFCLQVTLVPMSRSISSIDCCVRWGTMSDTFGISQTSTTRSSIERRNSTSRQNRWLPDSFEHSSKTWMHSAVHDRQKSPEPRITSRR